MAIAVRFAAEPTSREKYDQVKGQLEADGKWPPSGLQFHVAYGEPEVEGVFEVWESQEAFESFGETLMPLLEEAGINAGEPEVRPAYAVDNP